MLKSLRLRPILVSALVLACTREAVCDDLVTTYEDLFNDRVTITIPGYRGGTNKLRDFPLLIRLSEGNPAGFSYARVDSSGKDIRFLYVDGGAAPVAVPYEVDVWNTNGVSALWVRLPAVNNNSKTKLTMYWAPDDPSALPLNVPSSVWNGYSAVWHMNGAIDSTTNSVGAVVGASATNYAGVVGSALGTRKSGPNGAILTVPPGSAVDGLTGGAYTISGWLRVNMLGGGLPAWFYSARTNQTADAFGAELVSNSGVELKLFADGTKVAAGSSDRIPLGEWAHVAVTHASASGEHQVYVNGVNIYGTGDQTDKPGTRGLSFGGLIGDGAYGTLNGDLDDVRILPVKATPSWCTNEYLQVASAEYLAYADFYSTGKAVYVKKPTPTPPGGDDPSPGSIEDVSPADYAGNAVFVPADVPDGIVLTNFVTLIKVWEGEPAGFDPKTLPFGSEDIRFFDDQGNVLDFEIDTWNVDSDSLFWVLIPKLSGSTRITMCWGLREGRFLPEIDPAAVWVDYAGVWHMADAHDSTANAATSVFGQSTVLKEDGQLGKAAGTVSTGQNGAILDIEANEAIDSLTNGPFTVSGWVWLNKAAINYGTLFSRASAADPGWGAQFCGGVLGDNSRLAMQTGVPAADFEDDVVVVPQSWVRFDFVYAEDSLTFFIDGVEHRSVQARSILNGSGGRLSVGGFVSAAAEELGVNTLNGYVDEFRLLPGTRTAAERAAETAQCTDDFFYTRLPATWDETAVLQNRWKVYPSLSKTAWDEGEAPAEISLGEPWHGESLLSFQDRSTGEILAEMPTVGGDYRAIFTCPPNDRYSSLTHSIDFRIRIHRPSHDLGDGNDRILLLNGDQSIADGKVYVQSYSDSARITGRPYWVHDVDTGFDYTSTSEHYNFCGGLRHTYYSRDGEQGRARLWDLIDVRFGNTYNNADRVFDLTGAWEEWDEGLEPGMNYLAWNPQGGCLVDDVGLVAEGWHEYAAQAVMCNSPKASINSGLYTNGIGTIYLDCVNSHADDATNGYYRLVVEMATHALNRETLAPEGPPTDEAIAATHVEWDEARRMYVTVVHDPYKFADWRPLTMNVKLVNGETMTDLEPTNELDLALADGGSYTNFYRIYIPVDQFGDARFRIRRTAINPDYSLVTDTRSLILVDNVICSEPTARVNVEPCGFYDPTKVKRETVGYEGAFIPSYPSVSDPVLRARARAKTLSGETPAPGALSSVQMHYRWRYLDQQMTEWLTVDLDPSTLKSVEPLSWPVLSGDIEYWYEVNQSGKFYQYADYSGLNLGLQGYTEEVLSVTNRAETYETDGKDWFTRIRDGRSAYGTIKLFVRKGETEPVEEVEMFVARDRIWRGCLQATNAVPGGVLFRLEGRNRQDDSLEYFQFNTNFWHLSDSSDTLPVSGTVVAGSTNDWGRVPCDGATGHLLFQLDEETRALTVVHADWQDFNGWNDAHRDYFTGTSVSDDTKSGVSASQREYKCFARQWPDDSATNVLWNETFTGSGYDFYRPFSREESPNGFGVGEGMWVRGAYVAESSGMALQMAGQGRGYVEMVDPLVRPRGLESVRFNARIAQAVSPEDFAYYEGGTLLTNYTFLTRAAFDLNANSNFTGNASLSLAAFYRPNTACYEARWEQLDGNIEDGSGTVLGPASRGQRLALYRWKYEGREWKATELYAATNAGSIYSWKQTYSPKAIPTAYSITNGLMPFYIGAYDDERATNTLVIAAVHIPGVADASKNVKGNTAAATVASLAGEQGWLYVVYQDKSDERLKRGSYGVLSANCEGVFVRPQYHTGIVSWKANLAETLKLDTQRWPGSKATRGEIAAFYASSSIRDCVEDIVDGLWIVPDGRMESFYGTTEDCYYGFRYAAVTQTVDIYTAPIGTSPTTTAEWRDYEPVASYTLTGFGRPGVLQGAELDVWSADDSSVGIRPGGTISSVRTDVIVDNIQITQWRGDDWLGNNSTERSQGGLTNFVYTSGWVTNGALQLSPRRTPDGYPCSLRAPLCDGKGSGRLKRGIGLGSLSVWYRNAQPNARLLFQIATNDVVAAYLPDYTLDPGEDGTYWTTVTNFDFSTGRYPLDEGVLDCSVGLHGVAGVMRVIVDPTLRDEVKYGTDPEMFGSVEITQALFCDEPALDKGCWWGFNLRTIGDLTDVEQRMYLPDNPYRSLNPTLDEIGRSLALNNSITEDCDPAEASKVPNPFREHMPFLQTPTFASNIVGEVSFKARKYSLRKGSQCAEVRLYGTCALDVDRLKDDQWTDLYVFFVSNTTYETYRYKVNANERYRAFRLAVTGVDGVLEPGPDPKCGPEPVRVLIDDVLVSEAVRARLAFRNVGAFRHDIAKTTYVPNVPSTEEQPICGEGWGVQAEVYPAMLGEEVDMTTPPRVRLHYFKGRNPWGFANWKSMATSAWLTAATDTNLVYRSSAADSPAAVVPMANSAETVQYMLEVVYTVVNSETGGRSIATNWLESADWKVPSWYHPIDYNVSLGGGAAEGFSAFAMIEEIAPGWAWINEINVFGLFDSNYDNTDKTKQFVEIAKPVESSLEGWTLRMLAAKNPKAASSAVITNDVAVFGLGVAAEKATPSACNMSFVVVGNPVTTLSRTTGEYDGAWSFATLGANVFNRQSNNGNFYLSAWEPVAIQLVRPSGIIEHEVAILGTNDWNESAMWAHSSTNLVRILSGQDPNGTFFALPDDNPDPARSVGVYDSRGEAAKWWNSTMKLTPGNINEHQTINPDHPTPGGELIMVYAGVDTVFGRIVQTVGAVTNTTELQTISIKRGSEAGLDIYYTVNPWCELGEVKESENGTARVPVVTDVGPRQYRVNVAKGAERNVTVVASATVDSRLRNEFGLDENNRYTPAVLHWLERHKDAFGNDFYDWESGEIRLAKFVALSGNVVRDMTLTEMYWLDIDPTASNMTFRAGMVRPPSQEVVRRPTYDPQTDPLSVTNLRMGVYMAISNGNGRVKHDGRPVWAPYVLRGLGPDELSWNYSPNGSSANAWTSETFKATGFLNNGLTRESDRDAWIPLRYFVFWKDSFDANFEAEIDVHDPFSTLSPAYSRGWHSWVVEHGEMPPVYLSWNIDERLQPDTTEVLAPTNTIKDLP